MGIRLNSATAFLLFVLLISFAQMAYVYPQLPHRVAYHFGAEGRADAYGLKTTLLLLDIGLTLALCLTFFLLSRLPLHVSDRWLNLPNKAHWLAPPRRATTLQKLSQLTRLPGAFSLLFERAALQGLYSANLHNSPYPVSWVWFALAIYLAAVTALTVRLYRTFRLHAPALSDTTSK